MGFHDVPGVCREADNLHGDARWLGFRSDRLRFLDVFADFHAELGFLCLVYEPPERLVGRLAARPEGALMTLARSVADVLADHVTFEVESIDRMYLTVGQPRLAYGGGQGLSHMFALVVERH